MSDPNRVRATLFVDFQTDFGNIGHK